MTPRAITFLPCILKRVGKDKPVDPGRIISAVPRAYPVYREKHRKMHCQPGGSHARSGHG